MSKLSRTRFGLGFGGGRLLPTLALGSDENSQEAAYPLLPPRRLFQEVAARSAWAAKGDGSICTEAKTAGRLPW